MPYHAAFARIAAAAWLLTAAAPALAGDGAVSIPEPTDLALFALGVVGLVLGHHGARRRPRK